MQEYDVIVIGGGPGGAAAAAFLQRMHHRTLLLERSKFPRYHIGESLVPHSYGTLNRLGLLPALGESGFPRKQSVRFVSAGGNESQPFYFSETIPGDASQTWQVKRSVFDRMCLDNAREAGVETRVARVERVVFEQDRAVGVEVRQDGQLATIRGRVVVDASGRRTLIGSQLGLREPVPGLTKSAVWSYYRGARREAGRDGGETTIIMLPRDGWIWYIPLPDDIVSVGIVASPEYLFHGSADFATVFHREVAASQPLSDRMKHAACCDTVRGIRRLAYKNRRMAGDGWVMVGDAAMFLDPIYSSGIFLALVSAELAAGCIHDALEHDDVSEVRLGRFVGPLCRGIDVIHRLIHAFYDPAFRFGKFVQRFPEQRRALIDCLVGDVIDKDMSGFLDALGQMTEPPEKLLGHATDEAGG